MSESLASPDPHKEAKISGPIPKISLAKTAQKQPIKIRVVLHILDEQILIKDAPSLLILENGKKPSIQLAPIVEHIKKLGQPVS